MQYRTSQVTATAEWRAPSLPQADNITTSPSTLAVRTLRGQTSRSQGQILPTPSSTETASGWTWSEGIWVGEGRILAPAPLSLITLQNSKSDMLDYVSRAGTSSKNGTTVLRLSLQNVALIKSQAFPPLRKSELRCGTLGEHRIGTADPGTQGFDWVGRALGGATDHRGTFSTKGSCFSGPFSHTLVMVYFL